MTENLKSLGSGSTSYPTEYSPEVLEIFSNSTPELDVWVQLNIPEFTSLCPITGQPDMANFAIQYVPDKVMVESKSIKLYMFSFRNHGSFHEAITATILKDLVGVLQPRYLEVWGRFTPRGGISIDPYVNYGKAGTRWEEFACIRLENHSINPPYLTNRA